VTGVRLCAAGVVGVAGVPISGNSSSTALTAEELTDTSAIAEQKALSKAFRGVLKPCVLGRDVAMVSTAIAICFFANIVFLAEYFSYFITLCLFLP
jgi:hypothetical protein